ncbi:MAG: DUF4349 domain-containing protein [Acidimicrobiia bacterium]
MKKTLIALSISVLLIAGYFVGQAQFNGGVDNKSQSSYDLLANADTADGQSGSSSLSIKGSEGKVSPSSPDVSLVECVKAPCDEPTSSIGNPKGNKIVKTGTVDIRIPRNSVTKKYDQIVSLIPEGGYVEASSSSLRTSTITVRIPSEKLDVTLKNLRKVGKVTNESVNSLDRTFDAIDYDARLKIMRERETVLIDLLKKANSVSETSTIQEQIFSLRQDIEVLQGQKDLLDNQVALSTLTITIAEKGVKAKSSDKSESILSKAWTTSVGALLSTIGGILIVVSALFPFILLGLIVFFIIKKSRKKSN